MVVGRIPAVMLLAVLLLICRPPLLPAAEKHEEFNLREETKIEKEGNLLNLIFGSPLPMASERGILVIDAFHDANGNARQDPGEKELDRKEVFCLVDDIEYTVPAFIPALEVDRQYKVLCAGDRYHPSLEKKDLFIKKRGQIIRLDLPCRKSDEKSAAVSPSLR